MPKADPIHITTKLPALHALMLDLVTAAGGCEVLAPAADRTESWMVGDRLFPRSVGQKLVAKKLLRRADETPDGTIRYVFPPPEPTQPAIVPPRRPAKPKAHIKLPSRADRSKRKRTAKPTVPPSRAQLLSVMRRAETRVLELASCWHHVPAELRMELREIVEPMSRLIARAEPPPQRRRRAPAA